jgi:SOS-response transcriptional repressor LexA
MFDEWVKSAIEFGDISQAELSRRLSAKLGRSIDRAAVNKLLNGKRALAADEMIATAEMTGFPIPVEDIAGLRKVPKLSFVSAGRLEPSRSINASEIEGWVTASELPAGDWFALDVSGDSMNRVAPNGSTILVNRSDTDLRDGAFYVFAEEDGDGSTFKRYFSDPERLEPYSYTPDQRTIFLDQPARVVGRVRMAFSLLDDIVQQDGSRRK